MGSPPATIPAQMPLSEVLDTYLRGHEHDAFPVLDGVGNVIGLLTFDSARQVGQTNPFAPAHEAMIPLSEVATVAAETPLRDAVQRLGPTGAALVLRHGALVGALTAGDVQRWANANRVG